MDKLRVDGGDRDLGCCQDMIMDAHRLSEKIVPIFCFTMTGGVRCMKADTVVF